MLSELAAIMPPVWLSAGHRRRWHELFLDGPIDPELVAGNYAELALHFSAAVEAQGDAEPYDAEGRPSVPFQVICEAGAAMFQLQRALGGPPWRVVREKSPRKAGWHTQAGEHPQLAAARRRRDVHP